jgi:hypothetical protein
MNHYQAKELIRITSGYPPQSMPIHRTVADELLLQGLDFIGAALPYELRAVDDTAHNLSSAVCRTTVQSFKIKP